MSDEIKFFSDSDSSVSSRSNRRNLLKIGAASVPAIVSLKGGAALAQTAASLSPCEITVPDNATTPTSDETQAPGRTFSSEEVVRLLDGDPSTMVSPEFDRQYIEYIHGLSAQGSGISCVTSLNLAVSKTT
ncbi:MAG: hypothetical protein ACFBZ9_01390 [Sphingomonadales bacterium]